MKNYLIGFFIILTMVIIYLMFFSQSSLFTSFKLKKEINEEKKVLNSLQDKSGELQKNIKRLISNNLEYLDELARDKHDMSEPDEIIIFNNK